MEKFLKQIEEDLDKKLKCVTGGTIVKPFNKVYDQVRDNEKSKSKKKNSQKTLIYSEGEESIYQKVIAQFLKENPEFITDSEN